MVTAKVCIFSKLYSQHKIIIYDGSYNNQKLTRIVEKKITKFNYTWAASQKKKKNYTWVGWCNGR